MANLNSSNKKWASMSDNQKKDIQDALSRIRGGNGNETPQQALQRIASQGSYTPRSAFELTANPYTGEVYDGNKILNDYITKVRQANQIQRDYERSVKQLAMNELRMAAQEPLGDRNNPDLYQSRTRYSAKPRAAQQSTFDPSKVKIDPAQIAEFAKTQRIGNTAPKQYDFSNVDYKDWINSGESISSRTPEEMMRFDNTGVRQQSVAEKARELLRSVGRGSSNPYASTYQFGDGIQTRRTGSGGNTFMNQRMSDASEKYERAYMGADRNQRKASIEAAIRDPNNPLNLAEQFLANNPVEETGFTGKYKEYEAYAQMTNEQKAVYNYIYATYGPQQAEEYKDGLMDMLNARVGQEIYDTQIRDANTLEKALASYSQGVNSGLEGIANAPAALLGIDNRHATSPEEYAASYLRSDPNNSGVERVLYDLASSTGNMTPGIVASYLGAPQLVGSAMFGASQAGNAYNQALQNGNSVSQASAYAMQQFVDEELTNYLLGGVNAFGGGLVQRYIGAGPVGQAINNAINKVAKTETGRRILRSVAQLLGDAAGEAQQEYLQFFTENFTQALLGMRDENGDLVQLNTNPLDPDALYSAALGALNSLFLNTAFKTTPRVLNGRTADVSNARELADGLKEMTAEDFTGEASFKQAQEVQRIAEEIATKQENGGTVTAADKIAFNEAVSDMMTIGSETDEEFDDENGFVNEGFNADDVLMDLAMDQADAKEQQRQAVSDLAEQYYNENKAMDDDFQRQLDSATMLSQEEKYQAVQTGIDTATRTEMDRIKGESYGRQETGENGYRAGSERLLGDRTGEQSSRGSGSERALGEVWKAEARTFRDSEAATLRAEKAQSADQVISTALKGQAVYSVSGDTKETSGAKAIASAQGVKNHILYASKDGGIYVASNGKTGFARGSFDPETDTITSCVNNPYATSKQITEHETVHRAIAHGQVNVQKIINNINSTDASLSEDIEDAVQAYMEWSGGAYDHDLALEEVLCDIGGEINQFELYEGQGDGEIDDLAEVMREITSKIRPMLNEAMDGAFDAQSKAETAETLARVNASIDVENGSVNPLLSERLWNESMYVKYRDSAIKKICEAINVSKKQAAKYIDDINSVAKMISNDRTRYDYTESGLSPFVSNAEYGGSFDFDTLCVKRRIFIGTFQAIQGELPNTALTRDEVLAIRKMMDDQGLEVPCGKCYVEGSRAAMGEFTKKFLELYKKYYPNNWQPNMLQANTPDGIEWIRLTHPECYEQYEYFWNHYGTLRPGDPNLFASQQKPKLYMAHSAYSDEILREFKDAENDVKAKNRNGGIRFQSFSDFEIIHCIDAMQAIMDMSVVGLAGQAYTKQPQFALAFGNTGMKINLSIDAWGVDENGKLIFNNKEGMPFETAMELRNKYSDTVGTICCVYDDQMLLAALADDRIDFIIPFHRSQWKKSQYKAMGLPSTTKDYTYQQNEKWLEPSKHVHLYKTKNSERWVKTKCMNYMPNEYWDFNLSGKENAEKYLEMCYKDGKRPKFYRFLDKTMVNGKPKFSLKKDGSTDGYWKLLIDFKMYNNDGVGVPQMPVKPNFNMDEIQKMFDEYAGDHHSYPVAQGVVDEFVSKYKASHPGAKFSSKLSPARDSLDRQLTKEQAEYFKDSKIRDEDGNLKVMYHGTPRGDFTVFKKQLQGTTTDYGWYGTGFYFTDKERVAKYYAGYLNSSRVMEVYLNAINPYELRVPKGESIHRAMADIMGKIYDTKEEQSAAFSKYILDHGYDAIISDGQYIVFEPNQIKRTDNKKPTTDEDIRYSSNLSPANKQTYNQNIENTGFNVNYGLSADGQRISISPESYINDATWKKIHNAINKLGYGMPTVDSTKKYVLGGYGLQPDQTKAVKKVLGISNETEAPYIDPSEAKKIAQKAEKHFGTTTSFNKAAYITVNGKLLDFSEGQGYRVQDHREISEILDLPEDAGYSDGLIEFMNQGNIRLQTYGADIASEPNATQRSVLTRFINSLNGEFVLDLSNDKGHNIASVEYPEGTRAAKILADIDRYFKDDVIPDTNSISNFHMAYSSELAPTFYSKLQREIGNFKGDKIGAASVESYLKGKGVKDEEIKWSGIRQYLEGKKSVNKQELMDYLKANELQIDQKFIEDIATEETPYISTGYEFDYADFTIDEYKRALEWQAEANDEELVSYERVGNEIHYSIKDYNGNVRNEVKHITYRKDTKTRWSEYSLKGGENYREILFMIPGSDYTNRSMNTHWGKSGVLAHARVQDFTSDDGGKVLFVEEIQSDWHNAGHQYGYGEENQRAQANRYSKERNDYVKEKLLNEFPEEEVSAFLSNDRAVVGSLPWDRYSSLLDAEGKAEHEWNEQNSDKHRSMLKNKVGSEYVPDAPFKLNYTDFVLKDLLRMAAEGDYDYLAWTTGKMQEERWSGKYAEGYRIEYDQDIPKFLKKYGKQWGSNLTTIGIGSVNEEYFDESSVYALAVRDGIVSSRDDIEDVTDNGNGTYTVRYYNNNGEMQTAEVNKPSKTSAEYYVPAIDVNESMKESVLYEGQPMYSMQLKPDAHALERSAQTLHQLRNMRTIDEVKQRNERLAALDTEFNDALTGISGSSITTHQVNQIASKYINGLKADEKQTIRHDIGELYELLGNTTKTNARQLTEVAVDIADRILQGGVKHVQSPEAKALSKELKNTKFWISPELKKAIEYHFGSYTEFRRIYGKFMGMKLTPEKTSRVDTWYAEKVGQQNEDDLRGVSRAWFPSDIINEADQLLQIADVARQVALGEEVQEDYGDDYDEVMYTMANEIIADYFKANGNEKYMQKIEKVKQEMREEYEAKLDYIATKYNDKLAKNDEKVAKEQAKFLKYKEDQRNKQFSKAQRDRLWKRIRDLKKMKGNPQFEAEKAAIFEEISAVRKGALSKRTIDNLTALKEQTEKADMMSPTFSLLHHKKALEAVQELDRKHVGEMNEEEIATYLRAVTELITYQRNENRLLDESKGKYVSAEGKAGIKQQLDVKGIDYNRKMSKFGKTYILNSLAPTRALPMLDGYVPNGFFGKTAQKFFDGEMRTEQYRMEAEKMFSEWLEDEKYMRDLTREKVTLKNHNGQTIEVTKDIALAWYLAGADDGNVQHTEAGGWIVPDEKLYLKGDFKNSYNNSTRFVMNLGDYQQLNNVLSDKDKAFAEAAREYFDEFSRKHMDEVSMKLYGWKLSKSGHYLPIIVDKDVIPSDIDVYSDPTLENSGFTKARKNSKLAIRADGLTNILKRSINNVSRYYGLAIPLRDFNSVMNYAGYANPYASNPELRSMKGTFKSTWGTTGDEYVSNLVSDLNRGSRDKQKDLLDYVYMGYGSAVLGANVRVMLSQASSYPMALSILHADSLAKGLAARNNSVDMDYIDSITPSMYMRRKGMTGTQLGEMYGTRQKLSENKAFAPIMKSLDVLTSGIQRVDVWTTTHLVSACEAEMETYYPQYKKGTQAYDRKLAELIEQVNSRTQPSYSTMNRNEFSKRPGAGYKILTMFKTQTFNMYGEVADAVGRDIATRELAKKGLATSGDVKRTKDAVARAVVGMLLSQVMFEAIKKAVNLLVYHDPEDARDEQTGEVRLALVVRDTMEKTLADIISMPPGLGSVVNDTLVPIFKSLTGKREDMYDIDAPGLGTINDIRSSANYLAQAIKTYRDDPTTENRNKMLTKTAKFGIKLSYFGYPLQNLYNTVNGIWMNVAYRPFNYENGRGLFGLKDNSPDKAQYAGMAVAAAVNGDKDKAVRALGNTNKEQLSNSLGIHVSDKLFEKFTNDPDSMKDYLNIGQEVRESFEKNIAKANADGSLTDREIRDVALLMLSNGLSSDDAYKLYLTRKSDDKTAAEWVDNGHDFEKYLTGRNEMADAKEIKDSDKKRDTVVGYLKDYDGSKEEKQILWKLAGYGDSTYNKNNDPNSKEYKQAVESARKKAENDKKKAEKAAAEKARGVTAETKDLAKEIDAKIPEDTDKYLYVSQSTEYTPEQKVQWFKADSQRTEGKKYKAWKNAGGADYDYIKYRGDLSRYTGMSKSEKKSKVTEYINSTNVSVEKKRVMWTFAGYKESTCPW